MSDTLPFSIVARLAGGDNATFVARRDDKQLALERYRIGCGDKRRSVAEMWSNDPRLMNGSPIDPAAIEAALAEAELRALEALEDEGETSPDRGNAASRLVNYATNFSTLFHDPSGDAFAIVQCEDHKECHPLKSKAFRRWLNRTFYSEENAAAPSQAYQDALNALEGMAVHDGPEHSVHVRIAETVAGSGIIFVDLCDAAWNCVEVTATGWRVIPIASSPIYFVRRAGMLSLPTPLPGGTIDELRGLVNVPDDDAWRLVVGWAVMTFRPIGPYPPLFPNGEQGSAKSTLTRMLRALIDPNDCALRRPPREDRDLLIAARNSWLIAFDNLSGVKDWLSDALCMIATGGGFATRTLFENDEETRFSAMRPIIANGIDDLAGRSDLADRAISVTLPRIDGTYREEADIWREFNARRPSILGALLDGVSAALRNEGSVTLAARPRMIDFARWVEAAAPAFGWPAGSFLASYVGNREAATEAVIEANPIAGPIIGMMDGRDEWTGTAAELLAELTSDRRSTEADRRRQDWPTTPRALREALRRIAPNLRGKAIDVDLPSRRSGHGNRRLIVVRRVVRPIEENGGSRPVAQVATVANPAGEAVKADGCDRTRPNATDDPAPIPWDRSH